MDTELCKPTSVEKSWKIVVWQLPSSYNCSPAMCFPKPSWCLPKHRAPGCIPAEEAASAGCLTEEQELGEVMSSVPPWWLPDYVTKVGPADLFCFVLKLD